MGELLAEWPSAALTLFARYGVGGREKLGFRPEQRLRQVLSRYLVFDLEAVLQRLREAEMEQRQFRVSPAQFAAALSRGLPLVDCRSPQEMQLGSLPGARLLDAQLAAEVSGAEVLLFDQSGPMAGAAAVHLAGRKNCRPLVLDGGLQAWSAVDPLYPVVGGHGARILPDWKQARFVCPPTAQPLEGDPSLLPFACLRLWRSQDYLAILRDDSQDWPAQARLIAPWLDKLEQHPWRPQLRPDPSPQLRAVLAEQIQPDLQSHKGVVNLKDYREGIAYVELGGGCQGCSSAAITVGQEIAAALYRAVPELEGVEDASSHEDPQAQPHH